MNINQIKQALVVATEKNFTKAAKKLYVSQPSLSKNIKLLEEELKIQLFERNPISLTNAGKIFIKKAKKIMKDYEELSLEMLDISDSSRIYITVGIPSHRCYCFMPNILKKLYKKFPNCYIKIEEHPSFILNKMLDENKIDFYLGTENPNSLKYKMEHICDESVYVAYPKSWKIECENEVIDIQKLKDNNFIILDEHLPLSHYFHSLCNKNDFEPNIIIECNNAETVYYMINAGLGASILPELFIKYFPKKDNVCVKKIKNNDFKREFSIFYKKDKYLTKPELYILELFKDIK